MPRTRRWWQSTVPAPAAYATWAGAGFALMLSMGSLYLPSAPHLIFAIVFWLGVILVVVPIPTWYLLRILKRSLTFTWTKAVSTIVVAWVVAFTTGWLLLADTMRRWGSVPQPDVTACLIYPSSPALVLLNTSDQVAEQIKYSFALFDLDSADRKQPLQIPVATFDFIKGKSVGGPQDILSTLRSPTSVKAGDKVIGSLGISCPKCAVGHTYWISLVVGQGGWFSELRGETSGNWVVPLIQLGKTPEIAVDNLAGWIANVPDAERVPVRNLNDVTSEGGTVNAGKCSKG
jgi:hypothetical protein